MINVADIERILANSYSYNIIRLLREGLIKEEELLEKLTSKFKLKDKEKSNNALKDLRENKIITQFTADGGVNYYLLIKDFYIIRIPAKKVIEQIKKAKNIPNNVKKEYLSEVQRFFAAYIKSKEMLNPKKEQSLVSLIFNPEVEGILKILREKPMPLKPLLKKYSDFKKYMQKLIQLDILKAISDRDNKRNLWIILKSDLDFEIFYPEYMIKTISEKLISGEISKETSLRALSIMKRKYLENENPELLENLQEQITQKLEDLNSLREITPNYKQKVKALIKLYEEIGDYENKSKWKEKLSTMIDKA